MSLIDRKMYARFEINGEVIDLKVEHYEMKGLLARVVKHMIDYPQSEADSFNQFTLKVSKRPITNDSSDAEMDQFLKDNAAYINHVHGDDLIEGTQITWDQYESLRATDEWTNRFTLQTNPQNYTEAEAQSIKQAYDDKFLGTEFYGVGIKL